MNARPRANRLRDRIQRGDSYGLLLLLIILTYALMALLSFDDWGRVVVSALFGAILLLSLHTSHVRGRWVRIAAAVAIVSVGANVVVAILHRPAIHGFVFVMLVPVLAAPVVVLNRILRHQVVNIETLLGAISAYALIGIAFAAVYGCLNFVSPAFFAQPGHYNGVSYLYFSFVVITTLGFGDLTPGQDIGRVMVTLEALLGQIFLVTLVGRLVSQFGSTRVPLPEPPIADSSD